MSLRDAVEYVVKTFERDEAQGYRSRDRQFAIAILRKGMEVEDAAKGKSGLGRCPTCGEPGGMIEKRPNGNTHCINGHVHPSVEFV